MNDSLVKRYRQSAEFAEARQRIAESDALLGGLWGGSLAFFLAAIREAGSGSPSLVVTSSQEEADELLDNLEVFAGPRVLYFSPWESLFRADSRADPETMRDRLSVLEGLSAGTLGDFFVIAPVQALIQPVPPPDTLRGTRIRLRLGEEQVPREFAELLVRRGYRDVSLVEQPGEFSLRGDVLDIFPASRQLPLRLEFFGDTLESIREFDPASQRSNRERLPEEFEILVPDPAELFQRCYHGEECLLVDYLPAEATVFLKEPEAIRERARKIFRNVLPDDPERVAELFWGRLEDLSPVCLAHFPVSRPGDRELLLHFPSVERFRRADLGDVFESLSECLAEGLGMRVYCETEAEAGRFRELAVDYLGGGAPLEIVTGRLRDGFELGALGCVVLTARELFNRHVVRRLRRGSVPSTRAIQGFFELNRGDLVVHVVHGIARYLGIETMEKDSVEQEFLVLEYRGGVKVYVPVSKIDLVQKYVGSGDRIPVLDKLGGTAWERKKQAVETALVDLASELLEVQALREKQPGFAYPEDSEWQRQFEAAFPFQDTPDQVVVTGAIKKDMQEARPMDRLICGDVGYGKTELAMRAAFKALEAGRQVAVLVPTTVLAEQHYRTFRERMAEFPVKIEVLSRFRSPAKQRAIVERARSGEIDILVGTHRLLSPDVEFRDLGLVVIDEEQRFGVVHKERFKRMRSEVDVLTLSATPIPRTLHMALLGIRDISSLTTPPEGRSPIFTEVSHYDRRKIREIILRELNRDGQILFVHNRVVDIEVVEKELESVVPEARIDFAHGQMKESRLEKKMHRFLERETDVLIATTIIENGIDIPTANTIIINEADRYGLSDLHQLRGRVGRSKHQAYCYLLLPDHRHVNPEAQRRLQALVEFSGLGSGFQIAMRDLEIRGAGNILGKQQSGHIVAVGYDMYCRLLDRGVRRLKDELSVEPVPVEVDLTVRAFIPDDYVRGEPARIEVYRRIARLEAEAAAEELRDELKDRFGAVPPEVIRLLDVQVLRMRLSRSQVGYVGREDDVVIMKGGEAMKNLLAGYPGRVAVLDSRTVALPLGTKGGAPGAVLSDERLVDMLLDWTRTGKFPRIGAAGRRAATGRAAAPVPETGS